MFKVIKIGEQRYAGVTPKQILKFLKSLDPNFEFYMSHDKECLFARYFLEKMKKDRTSDLQVLVGIHTLSLESSQGLKVFNMLDWTVNFQYSITSDTISAKSVIPKIQKLIEEGVEYV